MAKKLGSNKDPVSSSINSGSLRRQRSDDSFSSNLFEKLDIYDVALKDDAPKLPSSADVSYIVLACSCFLNFVRET
jgi:hypothetical protein